MEAEFEKECCGIHANFLKRLHSVKAPIDAVKAPLRHLAEAKREDVLRYPQLARVVPKAAARIVQALHTLVDDNEVSKGMQAFGMLSALLPATAHLAYAVKLVLLGCSTARSISTNCLAGGHQVECALIDAGCKLQAWLLTTPAGQKSELLAALGMRVGANPSIQEVVAATYDALLDPEKTATVLYHAAIVAVNPNVLPGVLTLLHKIGSGGVAKLVPAPSTYERTLSPAEESLAEAMEVLGPSFTLAQASKAPGAPKLADLLKVLADRAGLAHLLRSVEGSHDTDQHLAALEANGAPPSSQLLALGASSNCSVDNLQPAQAALAAAAAVAEEVSASAEAAAAPARETRKRLREVQQQRLAVEVERKRAELGQAEARLRLLLLEVEAEELMLEEEKLQEELGHSFHQASLAASMQRVQAEQQECTGA
ncbi:hypothetical protein ABPG77_000581 [Micractinium sp. CCAP 211/92]